MKNKIIPTNDGSPTVLSGLFGVTYHSTHGAIQEAEHVFLQMGLNHLTHLDELRLLEIGFGTGLNAYMTLLEVEKHAQIVHYTGVEKYPIELILAKELPYPALLNGNQELFLNLHSCPADEVVALSDKFYFERRITDFKSIDIEDHYDLVYFDAFAPTTQPELWDEAMMKIIYRSLQRKGVLVTYCAKGAFRRALLAVGFTVERLPGPPGKREMLRATKPN